MVFSIGYDDDAQKARQIILDTVKANSMALSDPEEPFARVTEYAASSVDITLRVWCESADYWQLKFDLLDEVRRKFNDNGISIPYNQLDVHISNG